MSYKAELTKAMEALAADRSNVFIGYGITTGYALGTLKGVPKEQLIETPVAENLMASAAIGMSLAGFKPVVYVERSDFLLNASDAIVNHLNWMNAISGGEFSPAVIIRVTVGNRMKPLFTGFTHTQNFASAFRKMLSFPVIELTSAEQIETVYSAARHAQDRGESSLIFEFKDYV